MLSKQQNNKSEKIQIDQLGNSANGNQGKAPNQLGKQASLLTPTCQAKKDEKDISTDEKTSSNDGAKSIS